MNNNFVDQKDKELLLEKSNELIAKLPFLGQVAWLYMNSSAHKHLFVADMEWMLIPPIILNQFKLNISPNKLPLSYFSWAKLNTETANRYVNKNQKLAPGEWNNGEDIWLIDIVAPFGGVKELLDNLQNEVFPNQTINFVMPGSGKEVKVVRLGGDKNNKEEKNKKK